METDENYVHIICGFISVIIGGTLLGLNFGYSMHSSVFLVWGIICVSMGGIRILVSCIERCCYNYIQNIVFRETY